MTDFIHVQNITRISPTNTASPTVNTPTVPIPVRGHIINVVRKERCGYARAFPVEVQEDETMAALMASLKAQLGASGLKALLKKLAVFEEEAIFEAQLCSVSET